MELGGQEGDLVLGDLGDQVDQPDDKVAEAGEQANQTHDQGDDVLGLGEADNAIDTTDNITQEDLKQNSNDLGQFVVLLGKGLAHKEFPFLVFRIIPLYMPWSGKAACKFVAGKEKKNVISRGKLLTFGTSCAIMKKTKGATE
jgi:hypothetical protein